MNAYLARLRTATLAVSLMLGWAACGGDPAGPTEDLSNQVDNFEFQLSNIANYSSDRNFTWRNTGTRATVTLSSSITAGSSQLTIKDSAGQEVYSANMGQSGTFQTAVGATGDWRIEIDNAGVTGTLRITVKRAG